MSEQLNPAEEFELAPVSIGGQELSLHLGPLDMSINKAVLYLWLAAALVAVISIGIARVARVLPSRKQVAFEAVYEYVQDVMVGSVMPKEAAARWFPYIVSLFMFILASNIVGLIPLPHGLHIKTYAATANINVTVALAALTFIFTHASGIRYNGVIGYFKGWTTEAPPVLKQMLFVLHAFSELFRLISLSVRLFANLMAGHMVLLVFYTMILMLQTWLLFAVLAPLLELSVVAVSLFEIFVAVIQAYIFAILSAVYIGGAIEQEH